MKRVLPTLFLVSALAACGGGGGGGGTSGGGGGGPLPPTPTPTAGTTTTASGTVVNDAGGAPMSGVKVALRPWTACSTPTPTSVSCPTPLPAPQATTAADGSFTLTNAPNGHYFLVIGDDTPGSNVTTIHDNVTFTGGTVALAAPNMPPVPMYTPPATETGGKYRIRTLDATTQAPCLAEFNVKRGAHSLPSVVADEWLLENSLAVIANRESATPSTPPWPGNTPGIFADTYDSLSGGSTCSQMVDPAFVGAGQPALDPRQLWYGGSYTTLVYGFQQHLADPATVASTTGVVWP